MYAIRSYYVNGIGVLKDLAGTDKYNWHKNKLNSGSPSLGKTIDEGINIGISFRVLPQEDIARGVFFDSNGDFVER